MISCAVFGELDGFFFSSIKEGVIGDTLERIYVDGHIVTSKILGYFQDSNSGAIEVETLMFVKGDVVELIGNLFGEPVVIFVICIFVLLLLFPLLIPLVFMKDDSLLNCDIELLLFDMRFC